MLKCAKKLLIRSEHEQLSYIYDHRLNIAWKNHQHAQLSKETINIKWWKLCEKYSKIWS
jgi:hypothetical protein